MKKIQIGKTELFVKDYLCTTNEDDYILMTAPKLWLYVNVTNACQGNCPFCVNPSLGKSEENPFDLEKYRKTLKRLIPHIHGVSLTGGEPLIDVNLFSQILRVTCETVPSDMEIDMVTNGINLGELNQVPDVLRLTGIHISRHTSDDIKNCELSGWNAPAAKEIKMWIKQFRDPGAVTLNCVLQKSGVCDIESAARYMEMAADIGAHNVSFIGMFPANEYCRREYVSPGSIGFASDSRFRIWTNYHDYNYCSCTSGDYKSKNGLIRFYYRCPGEASLKYCRQLVYTADNRLLSGFGGAQIEF